MNIYCSAELSQSTQGVALLKDLSACLARHLRKPESYVMTCLVPRTTMTFAGSTEPACYAEIKNIGTLTPELTRAMTADLCTRLSEALRVPQNRIYLEFADAQPHLWGHDGHTFG